MSSKTFLNRLSKLKDAYLIENPVDLFYLTGLKLSLGALIASPESRVLFVDGRYIEFAKKNSPIPVKLLSKEALSSTLKPLKSVIFDSQFTSVDRQSHLQQLYAGNWRGISSPLKHFRAVKDSQELKAIKKSAELLWTGFEHLRKCLKVGITEKEAALSFELYCRKKGAEAMAFDPIVAFGKNSAYPHYRAANGKLKKGDIVLLDIGVVVDRYHSDMTRTFFFGKPDPRLILINSVVQKASAAALQICKPGIKIGELDLAARKVVQAAGLQELILHSLGHGIGLETHEFPRVKFQGEDNDVTLQEGMVITIEPGLYLAGVGGVRHEDMIVITSKGYKNFYA